MQPESTDSRGGEGMKMQPDQSNSPDVKAVELPDCDLAA